MAWNYARYIQAVTTKGKASYELPMYVNTWLASEDTAPGDYPSGGPQPRVIDIWKAAGSAIDIYSPDIYLPNFSYWANRYHRSDNLLFIPETDPAGTPEAPTSSMRSAKTPPSDTRHSPSTHLTPNRRPTLVLTTAQSPPSLPFFSSNRARAMSTGSLLRGSTRPSSTT